MRQIEKPFELNTKPVNNKHIPRKRFGQHFLTDLTVLNKIVGVLAPRPDENIIEIGPGTGALTRVLLERIDSLTAIELDRDLIVYLESEFGKMEGKRFELIQSDILRFDFRSGLKLLAEDGGVSTPARLRIVGNLPYNISTALIFHLLDYIDIVKDMVFMLQKEVAMRLSAKPGNKHYGRLTVMTNIECVCECMFDVPPTAFNPPPKVDSTVIRLVPRSDPLTIECRKTLSHIVSAAFSQRRKTIKNGLKKIVTDEQLVQAGIDPGQRAESIEVARFVALSNICSGICSDR